MYMFILKTILYKHNANSNSYSISKISNLLNNKPCHYVSVFKDSLIYGDGNEFLYCYYSLYASSLFIKKSSLTISHHCSLNFISKPLTSIIYKNKRSKHLIPKSIKHNTNPYAKIEYSAILNNIATVNTNTNTSEGTIYNNETNTEMMSLYSINLNINELYDYRMIEKQKDFADNYDSSNVNDNTIAMINMEWMKGTNKNNRSNIMTPNICKKTFGNFNAKTVYSVKTIMNTKPKAKSAVKNILKERNGTPNKGIVNKNSKMNLAMSMNNKKELFLSTTICGDNKNLNKSKCSKQSQPHAQSKIQRKIDFSLTFTPGNKMKCNKSTINNNTNNHSTNTSTPKKNVLKKKNSNSHNNECNSSNCNWNNTFGNVSDNTGKKIAFNKTQTTPRLQKNNNEQNIMKVNINANGNYGNVICKKRSFKQIKLNLNSKGSNCISNNNNMISNNNSYYYYPKKNIPQTILTSSKKSSNNIHNRNNNIITNKSAVLSSYKTKDKSQTSIHINNLTTKM